MSSLLSTQDSALSTSSRWLDQAVVAVLAAVEDVDLVVVGVEEDEEVVAEQFELVDRLGARHRLEREALGAHNLAALAPLLVEVVHLVEVVRGEVGERGGLRQFLAHAPAVAVVGALAVVAPDAPAHLVDDQVDRAPRL